MNQRRFTPNHYPIRPDLCVICCLRLVVPGKSICSGCYQSYGYADFDPDLVKRREKQEAKWLKRTEWQPATGTYTMSGAAVALPMTVRGVYKAMERHNIAPEHNGGHSVITDVQLSSIEQQTRKHQREITINRWDDGTIKITTKLAGELIGDDSCSVNALARKGIVSGFLKEFPGYGGFAANRWQIDALALENYLAGRQRHEDAQQLHQGIQRLCSGLDDRVVAE